MRRCFFLLLALSTLTFSCGNPKPADSSESWCSEVWEKCSPIYDQIIRHPFIVGLADGSLSSECFSRYLAQDVVYCDDYYQQLARFGGLLTDGEEISFFAPYTGSGDSDGSSVPSESVMQQSLLEVFGVDPAEASSVTAAYSAHEQAAVDTGSKEIAIAALLPCIWIYEEVGSYILSMADLENNPYREWILEYGNEEYAAWVKELLVVVDSWAEAADEATRAKMTEVFVESAQFEYDFWDYGYTGDAGGTGYTGDAGGTGDTGDASARRLRLDDTE